jgi:hypothetical protein
MKPSKFAVFVNDGFDSMFEDKEKAKVYTKAIREKYRKLSNKHISARVYKLTKYDIEAFGI